MNQHSLQCVEIKVEVQKVHEVCGNLLSNSLKAVARNLRGEIALSACVLDSPDQMPTLKLQVKANGPGIPGDLLPSLFEPYANSRHHGDNDHVSRAEAGVIVMSAISGAPVAFHY